MAFDPFPGLLADWSIPFSTTLVPEKFLEAQSHDTPVHNYYYFLILLEAHVKRQAALQIHTTVQLPKFPFPAEVPQNTKMSFPRSLGLQLDTGHAASCSECHTDSPALSGIPGVESKGVNKSQSKGSEYKLSSHSN